VDSSPRAVMAAMRSTRRPIDGVYCGYFLNENTLLLQMVIESKFYLELFDKKTGSVVNTEKILSPPWPVLYAADNLLFVLGPPRRIEGESGQGNPCVIRYRYKAPSGEK
ncbi:MAG: hypothetical protein ACPL7K_05460, partial [Armatimonadota bacterium]